MSVNVNVNATVPRKRWKRKFCQTQPETGSPGNAKLKRSSCPKAQQSVPSPDGRRRHEPAAPICRRSAWLFWTQAFWTQALWWQHPRSRTPDLAHDSLAVLATPGRGFPSGKCRPLRTSTNYVGRHRPILRSQLWAVGWTAVVPYIVGRYSPWGPKRTPLVHSPIGTLSRTLEIWLPSEEPIFARSADMSWLVESCWR